MTKVELNQLNEAIKHCDEVIENLKLKGNCDECLKQHEQLKEWLEDYKFIKEKIEWLKEEMTEQAFNLVFSTQEFLHSWYKGIQITSAENAILQRKLSDYENPQPYKFEDLKEGMWVWDDKAKWIYKIKKINGRNSIEVDNGDLTYTSLVFEENRFYPVTKAMEYQE